MEKKQNRRGRRAAFAALFCSLVFAATWISIPAGLGNVNLGDALILATAWLFGGPWAVLVSGVGAALADLLAGYAVYAPGTLLIKATMVLVALGVRGVTKRCPERLSRLLAGAAAELTMVTGYFLYESFVLSYGMGAALLSVPLNAVQGLVGLAVAELLVAAAKHTHAVERMGL